MKRPILLLAAVVATMLIAGTAVLADVPPSMNVQGRLTDNAGVPVAAGIKVFTFKIFDAPAAGTEIWPAGPGEIQPLATDADGLWNAGVGDVIPLTEAVFQSPVRWLEINVNDGVNPPETLPRIELRTNPYTYRAATSQQADSLGGVAASGFVLKTGDIMTGPLGSPLFQAGNAGLDGTVQVMQNGSAAPVVRSRPSPSGEGGELYLYDELGNATALIEPSFAGGEGGVIALYRDAALNPGWFVNANWFGSANPFMMLDGTGGSVVFDLTMGGDASVSLGTDAISAPEILDEPGIAAGTAGGTATVTTTEATFATVTLTPPAAGYALVIAEAVFAAVTVPSYIDATLWDNGSPVATWEFDPGDADGWYDQSQTRHVALSASPGAHTYTLRLQQNVGTSGIFKAKLTAIYFPTAYGAVSSPVAANGGGAPAGSPNAEQHADVDAAPAIDVEADRALSIAANQARIDRELEEMRAEIAALRSAVANPRAGDVPVKGDQ